ncbi:MbtH family protein [Paenibacillus sp. GYB003]|uniref:MbtH family protein n=1 Tax=Paenibacillus sp. GYB003 TaxID=2994392 RepID=UPI002F965FBF
MGNPFEAPDGVYHVLVNEDGQYSLWPAFVPVPPGWIAAFEGESRERCLEYVEAHWTDMRPRSLTTPSK